MSNPPDSNNKYANYLKLDDRLEIERLLKKGLSNREIAKAIGKTRVPVDHDIRRNGGKLNYRAHAAQLEADKRKDHRHFKLRREFSKEQIQKIEELRAAGMPMNQIRKEIGASYDRMERYCREHGHHLILPSDSIPNRLQNLEEQVSIILDILRSKK